ncbi:hypothetical protein BDV96DRAFT_85063 [Lophiotrema nucula]|uniref:TM7S3/TM198-like domain-containing protein n=1 Tax=Lophiotrema nucula TaxID=690887 RepID=A0A6A5Z6X9_9PLEO|nr:hypothetical protein BDV96DRAFT_85063 [Lophiotrema nucula]
MRSFRHLLLAVALLLCVDLVTARHAVVRQDDSPSSTKAPASTREGSTQTASATPSEEASSARQSVKASQATSDVVSSSAAATTATAIIHAPASTSSEEPAPSTTGISANGLPIKPKISPAMGLAGVILLISGAVYTVIGIKNKWLYVFFSAAYLTSLAVSVLIVYLMSPPVTDAVQGAFFVAAFLTGIIFGSLALVFADITDGLGCLLGGFCLSMWFLTLKEGGLITSTTGRAVFIGVMSFAGFSLSFSHYTRNYGLIVSISFAGATITMLGVDCLSCAGWKEFWLYLWNLNDNTFPLHTNTYPITRGIKVEVACVVILCILGLVSQLQLWKVVKERREKSAAQRLERDRSLQQEEEELGRRIEDDFARDRAQWEATYGDKSLQHDSAVESSSGSFQKSSVSIKEKAMYEGVEMVNMIPRQVTGLKREGSKISGSHAPTGPTVTVTVLQDDHIQEIDDEGNPVPPVPPKKSNSVRNSVTPSNAHSSARPSTDGPREPNPIARSVSAKSSLYASVPPPPVVVPLPFTVPKEEDDQSLDADNASVSAVPESMHARLSNPRPLSKRLSGGSMMKRLSASRLSREHSDSEEALIIPHIEDDGASSVAATLDDDHDAYSLPDITPPHSPLAAERSRDSMHDQADAFRRSFQEFELQADGSFGKETSVDGEKTKTKEILRGKAESGKPATLLREATQLPQSLTSSTDPKPSKPRKQPSLSRQWDALGSTTNDNDASTPQAKSVKTATPSQSSRTGSQNDGLAGVLPDKLSRVALSYRTNEWAKHLELAETPDLEVLPEPASPGVKVGHQVEEPLVTASIRDSLPSQMVPKGKTKRASTESFVYRNSNVVRSSSSDMAKYANAEALHALSRSPSAITKTSPVIPTNAFPSKGPSRPGSNIPTRAMRSSSTPHAAPGYLNSPTDEVPMPSRISPVPFTSGNTLMSQRENLVRNKAISNSFTPNSSSPILMSPVDSSENLTLAQRRNMIQKQKPPSASQQRRQSGRVATGSGQPQIYDSHQPRRSSGGYDQDRREVMLANWRESIRHEAVPAQPTVVGEQARRAVMITDRRQKETHKQQQVVAAQYRDSMMDSMMRSGEMLDVHREAMRRMQAKANKVAK